MHFLRTGVNKRFDAHETTPPAPTGQIDVVGGFKVIAAVVLAQLCAETDSTYAVAGVVLAPQFVDLVEILGTDGVVRLEAEIALGFHEVDDIVAAALDGVHAVSYTHLDVYKRQPRGAPATISAEKSPSPDKNGEGLLLLPGAFTAGRT